MIHRAHVEALDRTLEILETVIKSWVGLRLCLLGLSPNLTGVKVGNIEELITKVYPDISQIENKDHQWMCQRAILAARNSNVDEINDIILSKLPGDIVTYTSIDTVMDQEDVVNYPQEFLNSLNPSGLPPHSLNLKIGAPIILLRNLKPPNLCNGTRLQVKFLRNNVIVAIVLTGPAVGQTVLIPRIPMIPNDLPFNFKEYNFRLNYPSQSQ
ncbi:hypothetical protein EVAR_17365_1 [Eumeta japonica]|uniref:DNA helicase Pif1-like 2B domain-containing protein n=1 Tax=Eumeta variegata TaxID=151549 RepID=A0A4C1WIZ6_EUMVA|nr:hypothetical protein EVAR_17365_1 [Eumeta japonica]